MPDKTDPAAPKDGVTATDHTKAQRAAAVAGVDDTNSLELGEPAEGTAQPATETPAPEQKPEGAPGDAPAAPATLFSNDELGSFTKEFDETGSLSEKSMKSIVDKGVPAEVLKTYTAGIKAMQEAANLAVIAEAGGEGQWNTIQKWSKAGGTTAEQRNALNVALKSRNVADIRKATAAVVSAYRAANGSPAAQRLGGAPAPAGPAPFPSKQAMVDAMKDPRYDRDPSFRASIAARIAVSVF